MEIDPNFALAQATLGREYADLDESDLSAESHHQGLAVTGPYQRPGKVLHHCHLRRPGHGKPGKGRQNDEAWAQTYPRDPVPHSMLAGYPNKAAGRYEQALVEARKAIELDPDFAMGYYNLGCQ